MQIRVAVYTAINDVVVDMLGGMPATWEGTEMSTLDELKKKAAMNKKPGDKYAVLDPQGPAEIRVGLEEKVSGPSGTYSSVTVFVQVQLRTAQTPEAVKKGIDLAHSECVQALERYIDPALTLLCAHLERRGG
jgi:hypothetical protein